MFAYPMLVVDNMSSGHDQYDEDEDAVDAVI